MIADGKRGDIGSTARAYAAAFLEPRGSDPPLADALTVNPYLGTDSMDPFLSACRNHGAGLFCLVRTSNAGGRDLQDAVLSDGTPVWRHVAGLVDEWGADLVGERGMSSVGAVVGATVPRVIGDARRAMPQAIILLPGVGAQGATPADVARAFTSGPASALVNASRSVIYAYRDTRGRLARRRRQRGGPARGRDLGRGRLVATGASSTFRRDASRSPCARGGRPGGLLRHRRRCAPSGRRARPTSCAAARTPSSSRRARPTSRARPRASPS